jgi:hypothetical protein
MSRLSLLVLTLLSVAFRAPFPTSWRKRTWPRDVVYIALKAHQKAEIEACIRVGFRPEVANGVTAEAI